MLPPTERVELLRRAWSRAVKEKLEEGRGRVTEVFSRETVKA